MNELTTINPVRITDLDSAMKVAAMLAKSGYWKETGTAEKAFVKIMLGLELGIGPLASMRGIEIDYLGRVTLMANLQAALVKASRQFNYHLIVADDQHCAIEFLERNPAAKSGDPDEWRLLGISELTIDQAKAANMHMQWDANDKAMKAKQTWKSYPSDMLFARCITRGVKRYVPHITNGLTIYDPDELQGLPPNYIEAESRTVETEPPSAPDQPTTTATTTVATTTQNAPPAQKEAHAAGSSGTTTTDLAPELKLRNAAIAFKKKWTDRLNAAITTHPEHAAMYAQVAKDNAATKDTPTDEIIARAKRIMVNVCNTTGEIEETAPGE